MKALISPNECDIQYIAAWKTEDKPPTCTVATYANSCRVAEVKDDTEIYPVGGGLFWTSCTPDVIADAFYFDTKSGEIKPINHQKLAA